MRSLFRQLAVLLFAFFLCALPVSAEEPAEAQDLTEAALFTEYSGFQSLHHMYDGYTTWGVGVTAPASLTMHSDAGIGSVYIRFAAMCGEYTITDPETGASHLWEHQFLHDFVDLEALFGYVPTSVTLSFNSGTITINELTAYSAGEVPEDVQRWTAPGEGQTDLVLFSTHGDDEHLFFAGILPYYATELDYQVQVVYLTNHYNSGGSTRMREMLDGLWAVGIRTYPIFGEFPDFRIDDLTQTYSMFRAYGYSQEDLIAYVVEQIRRFDPKVVIGHDFAGEYGHGQHQVYADILSKAVEISMDPEQYPESAERYGIWDVPKAYFHLYEENQIVMDWDQPLESFNGMTAFQVSIQIGFQQHKSQVEHFSWYYAYADTAAEVRRFNPCYYGLYRSTVGEDVEKNDFFENVTTYAEDAALEAQRLAEEEAARIAAEEEAARIAAEEEAARIAAEEAARIAAEEEAARIAAEEAAAQKQRMILLVGAVAAVLIGTVIAILLRRKRTKNNF